MSGFLLAMSCVVEENWVLFWGEKRGKRVMRIIKDHEVWGSDLNDVYFMMIFFLDDKSFEEKE